MPRFDWQDKDRIVEAPNGWEGGKVWHTGGGIWCRSWEGEAPDGRHVEVIYNRNDTTVGWNLYPPEYPEDIYTGPVDCGMVSGPTDAGDLDLAELAVEVMEQIDNGEFPRE